jgi:hypothetical protein
MAAGRGVLTAFDLGGKDEDPLVWNDREEGRDEMMR